MSHAIVLSVEFHLKLTHSPKRKTNDRTLNLRGWGRGGGGDETLVRKIDTGKSVLLIDDHNNHYCIPLNTYIDVGT